MNHLASQNAPIAPMPEKVGAYVEASRGSATKRAYLRDWSQFQAWCDSRGVASMPASPGTIALYIADLADSFKPSTLNRKLASLSVAHKAAGFPSPIGAEVVRSTMSGIRRKHSVAQTRKVPVRVANIRRAMQDFPQDLQGIRDRAILLIGYAGAFRRSELVALDVADMELVPEGVILNVRRSKTDQEGRGHRKAIEYGRNPLTCPVKALRDYLATAGITEGAIFRRVDRWGKLHGRLSSQSVALIVKDRARLLGIDPDTVAAHSLRAGLVTDGYAEGASESDIMRQTGHRSRAVLEVYRREANLFKQNVTAKVGL